MRSRRGARFDFVINRKTQALGLTLPPSRADEVIQ
jgi:hypothetical protein